MEWMQSDCVEEGEEGEEGGRGRHERKLEGSLWEFPFSYIIGLNIITRLYGRGEGVRLSCTMYEEFTRYINSCSI